MMGNRNHCKIARKVFVFIHITLTLYVRGCTELQRRVVAGSIETNHIAGLHISTGFYKVVQLLLVGEKMVMPLHTGITIKLITFITDVFAILIKASFSGWAGS